MMWWPSSDSSSASVAGRMPEAPCPRLASEPHHQPRDQHRHRLADPHRVRKREVPLQRREIVPVDPDRRQLAEPGVDPVDRLPPRDDPLDRRRAGLQRGWSSPESSLGVAPA